MKGENGQQRKRGGGGCDGDDEASPELKVTMKDPPIVRPLPDRSFVRALCGNGGGKKRRGENCALKVVCQVRFLLLSLLVSMSIERGSSLNLVVSLLMVFLILLLPRKGSQMFLQMLKLYCKVCYHII